MMGERMGNVGVTVKHREMGFKGPDEDKKAAANVANKANLAHLLYEQYS